MTQLSKPDVASFEPSAGAETRVTKTNKRALDFIFGAQTMMLEEIVFANNEMFDRALTEMRLFSEFVSKTAGAHSVKDIRTLAEECGRHQIDFIGRDCERLFKHGKRMIETASDLFSSRPQN